MTDAVMQSFWLASQSSLTHLSHFHLTFCHQAQVTPSIPHSFAPPCPALYTLFAVSTPHCLLSHKTKHSTPWQQPRLRLRSAGWLSCCQTSSATHAAAWRRSRHRCGMGVVCVALCGVLWCGVVRIQGFGCCRDTGRMLACHRATTCKHSV